MTENRSAGSMGSGFFSRSSDMYLGGPAEGLLQKLHPAARIIGAIILLLGTALCREPVALLAIFAGAITLATLSYLNLASIYRVLLLPVILLALPAWILAAFLHGRLEIGSLFFIRTLASVSVATVALHSVGLKNVAGVLEKLRVPYEIRQMWTIMVAQVSSFAGVVADMAFARNARQMIKPKGNAVRVQVGRQAGILFSRTWHRGNELAAAMDARAISSNPGRVLHRSGFTAKDHLFVAVCAGLSWGIAVL